MSETEETSSTPTESSSVVALGTSSDGEDEASGTRLREDQESRPRFRSSVSTAKSEETSSICDESVMKQKKERKGEKIGPVLC